MHISKEFTDKEYLKLKTFKYTCVDKSILQNLILKKAFNSLQKLVPFAITPNQITFSGMLCMLTSLILTFVFDPTLDSAPRFLPLANLFLLVLYFIADGIDGIHARATKRTSSLGSMLDHGIDSLACLPISLSLASSLGLGFSKITISLMTVIFLQFYLSMIHQKYTGVFEFGLISGCTEGLVTVACIHLFSFLRPDLKGAALRKISAFSFTLRANSLEWIFVIASACSILSVILGIVFSVHKNRLRDLCNTLYTLFPLIILYLIGCLRLSSFSANSKWAFLLVFSHCFTQFYLEEYLSFIAGADPNSLLFFIGYVFLGVFSVVQNGTKYHSLIVYSVAVLSFALFLYRIRSLINNTCRGCGVSFLF
ncbi:ethanolaminephosphotransferase [Enteropsectra breve]|nr:ethanolaminephosphotransferase [Enteropsectra breve]